MEKYLEEKKYIYKFVPFSINALKLLIKGEIYLGFPYNLNDPFEGEFLLEDFEIIPDENFIIELYTEVFKTSNSELERKLARIKMNPLYHLKKDVSEYLKKLLKTEYGVSCFTKNPHNILMWSHYADSHKGLCLGFDRKILLDSLNKLYPDIKLDELEYDAKLKTVKPIYKSKSLSFSDLSKIFLSKLDHWTKEDEVRVHKQFDYQETRRSIPFDKKALKIVIFGENMEKDNRDTIVYLINSDKLYNIKWAEAKKDFSKLHMKLEENGYVVFNDFTVTKGE